MPLNQIDSNGIQIQTYEEILSEIINGTINVQGLKQIYGSDINVDSNTPDGQLINIFALAKSDVLSLIVQSYNSKDPDQAIGTALDGISQLCGIIRQGGTFTKVKVNVTVDRNVNLNGQDTVSPFTVSDGNGNLFQLITSQSLIAGTTLLDFQAVDIGFIQVLANTIIIMVTVQVGVTAVNNPTTPFEIGQDQETDSDLRIRRQRSTALPAHGVLQGLHAGLNSIEGLAEAVIYENYTDTLDVNLVPAHSIWVIVDGGSDEDVAAMIYRYRNAGCGMKGTEGVTITQIDGSTILIYFDRADYQDLYLQFNLTSLSGGFIDYTNVVEQVTARYLFGIYEAADITTLSKIIKEINPDLVATDMGVSSDGISYSDILYPDDKKSKWVISQSNIDIPNSSSSSSSCRSSSSSSKSSSSSSSSCRSSSSSSCSKSSSSSSSCKSSSSSCSSSCSSSSRSSSSSSRSSSSSSCNSSSSSSSAAI